MFEEVVYSITELFSLHPLEYLQNHSIQIEVKVMTDVGLEHI
jgi:hypothetical protein